MLAFAASFSIRPAAACAVYTASLHTSSEASALAAVIAADALEANQKPFLFWENMTRLLRKERFAVAGRCGCKTECVYDSSCCQRAVTANCLQKTKLKSASSKAESSLPW